MTIQTKTPRVRRKPRPAPIQPFPLTARKKKVATKQKRTR